MPKLEFFVARKTDMQNLLAQKLLTIFAYYVSTPLATFDSTHIIYDGAASQKFNKTGTVFTDDDWDTKCNTSYWSFMLYRMSSLRRLNIVPNMTPLPTVREVRGSIAPLSFPNLQYLYLTEQFPYYIDLNDVDSSSNSTTHAFHLVFSGSQNDAEFMADYVIRSPGLSSRLTTFEWGVTPMKELQPLFDAVTELCPNLRNLILVVVQVSWHIMMVTNSFPSTTLPKSILRLALRSYRQEDKRSVMGRLCDLLSQISETAKSLQVPGSSNCLKLASGEPEDRSSDEDEIGRQKYLTRGLRRSTTFAIGESVIETCD